MKKIYIHPTSRYIALHEEAELMQSGSIQVDVDPDENVDNDDKTRRQGSGTSLWDNWAN